MWLHHWTRLNGIVHGYGTPQGGKIQHDIVDRELSELLIQNHNRQS